MQGRELLRTTVPEHLDGIRLQDFLHKHCRFSRSLIRRLKAGQGLRVNGALAFTTDRLRAGDQLVAYLQEEPSAYLVPEYLPLDIIYEDQDLLVVNKPAGMVLHPARQHLTGTLANAVAGHFAARGLDAPVRPVQRLDRDTSGVVVFAKNPWIHDRLAGQLHRTYLAVAAGQVAVAEGQVDAPIRPDPTSSVAREVHPSGQAAETRYRVLRCWADATLLEVTPVTGRTHQIRVHMAHLGHPLLGDTLYGSPDPRIARQALHAARLTFTHPRAGQTVALEAPLPADFRDLLARLDGVETARDGC